MKNLVQTPMSINNEIQDMVSAYNYKKNNDGKHYTEQDLAFIEMGRNSGKSFAWLQSKMNRSKYNIEQRYLKHQQEKQDYNEHRVSVHKKTIKAIIEVLMNYKETINDKYVISLNEKKSKEDKEIHSLIKRLKGFIDMK
jgi:hypothetical protein